MYDQTITAEQLTRTHDSPVVQFTPSFITSLDPIYGHNFPIWSLSFVPTILRDSRVSYGLKLIKGPIKAYTLFLPEEDATDPGVQQIAREEGNLALYTVTSDSEEVSKYVLESLKMFWANGLEDHLTKLDWGFSCMQPIYELENPTDKKSLVYSHSVWYYPMHCRPLIYKGTSRLAGANITQVDGMATEINLYGPKLLWGVHRKRVHPLYGQSILYDCFTPFHEQWAPYGARDIRRTWFHKNSYDGGEIRYPIGKYKDEAGNLIDHRDIALGILAKMKTGGGRAIPSTIDPQSGKPLWEYNPPTANATPQGLMEYPEALRIEILEGLGVPPEVVESSSSNGMGSATGRKIPMSVYYSTLSSVTDESIQTFDKQSLRYAVKIRFGNNAKYKIEKVSLLKAPEETVPGQQPGGSLEKQESSPELTN